MTAQPRLIPADLHVSMAHGCKFIVYSSQE
jgi:hypothetical protein